jgi:hypothetical protein
MGHGYVVDCQNDHNTPKSEPFNKTHATLSNYHVHMMTDMLRHF